MKYFTSGELLSGILAAILYGAAFSLLSLLLSFASIVMRYLLKLPKSVIFYSRVGDVTSVEKKPERAGRRLLGEIYAALLTVLFTVGFILLSYYCLDGSVRVYMLVLSLFGLLITNAASGRIKPFVEKGINALFYCVAVVLRALTLPIKIILTKICRFWWKNICKFMRNIKKRAFQDLDKHRN